MYSPQEFIFCIRGIIIDTSQLDVIIVVTAYKLLISMLFLARYLVTDIYLCVCVCVFIYLILIKTIGFALMVINLFVALWVIYHL